MRHGAVAVVLAALVLAPGCGGGDRGGGAHTERTATAPRASGRAAAGRSDAALIRGWLAALNAGHYAAAAAYFAPGAIVEQTGVIRLRDRRAAEAFNRSLPCRADITDIAREGSTTVAAFKLRRGTGPVASCGGSARVRFRIRSGKFTEWRQLPEPAAPPGVSA